MMNNTEKLTFKQKIKSNYGKFKKDWENPTKKRIRANKTMFITGSIIRTLLLIGLVFIILLPIFKNIICFRHQIQLLIRKLFGFHRNLAF